MKAQPRKRERESNQKPRLLHAQKVPPPSLYSSTSVGRKDEKKMEVSRRRSFWWKGKFH